MDNKPGKPETAVLALQMQDTQKLHQLLEEHQAWNQPINQFGDRALHYSAHLGFLGIVKSLIQNGADPNVTNEAGYTPLDVASHNKQVDVVHYLIGAGAVKTPFFNKDYGKN